MELPDEHVPVTGPLQRRPSQAQVWGLGFKVWGL